MVWSKVYFFSDFELNKWHEVDYWTQNMLMKYIHIFISLESEVQKFVHKVKGSTR